MCKGNNDPWTSDTVSGMKGKASRNKNRIPLIAVVLLSAIAGAFLQWMFTRPDFDDPAEQIPAQATVTSAQTETLLPEPSENTVLSQRENTILYSEESVLPSVTETLPEIQVQGDQSSQWDEVSLPALAGNVAQVVPMPDGAAAVLLTDGRVKVAGNSELAEKIKDWRGVAKLFSKRGQLAAIRVDGTALSTNFDLSQWDNVKELYFTYSELCGVGLLGLKNDGTIETTDEPDGTYYPLTEWADIQELYFSQHGFEVYGLNTSGKVVLMNPADNIWMSDELREELLSWEDLRELYISCNVGIYGLQEDGSVLCAGGYTTAEGLRGSVKLIEPRMVVGLSADGRLLSPTGALYVIDQEIYEEKPDYESVTLDMEKYRGIRDLINCNGIIMLKKDGTVDSINYWGNWDFRTWKNVEKLYAGYIDFTTVAYGIQKDGAVIVTRDVDGWNMETIENYLDWNLVDLFMGDDGVIGLTPEGDLVGDGAYESIAQESRVW